MTKDEYIKRLKEVIVEQQILISDMEADLAMMDFEEPEWVPEKEDWDTEEYAHGAYWNAKARKKSGLTPLLILLLEEL